jgi:nucleoside-diphosphate kinase
MPSRTLTIIKPDAVANGHLGKIISKLEETGFRVVGIRKMFLTETQAQAFYAVHRERPFYGDLVRYMTSGPVFVAALESDGDAVPKLRAAMGATDPAKADEGTIRKSYGESIERNAIHGSDSPENAEIEINFFFAQSELV